MSFPRTKRSPRQWGAPDNTPLSLPPGVLLCTRQQNVSPLTGRTLKALRPHTAEYPPATLEDENLGQSQSQSPCSEAMDSFSNPTLASSTFLFCCECILCVIRINCQRPPCRVLLSFFFFLFFLPCFSASLIDLDQVELPTTEDSLTFSTVPATRYLVTKTCWSCPSRCALPIAWLSTLGFHCGSKMKMWLATVRFSLRNKKKKWLAPGPRPLRLESRN